ncbi:MAG: hypothetical protein PUE43_00870 [Clostridium sp.]|jgi:hypothetical protein|nr:hypothetical protein [Clostridium sp.]
MYKYIRALVLGYEEGLKVKQKIKIKNYDKKKILSKLYDIGYIEGVRKNNTLKK